MAKKASTVSGSKATKCPITRADFLSQAKPISIKVGEGQLVASVKEFATNSLGWFASEKIVVTIGDVPVKVQANISLVVVGSKEAG